MNLFTVLVFPIIVATFVAYFLGSLLNADLNYEASLNTCLVQRSAETCMNELQ